ncbi:nitroreductase/quinone reductase family protein [Leifsonia sp. YAF41]|uniref:nitroreductase/quinone reductase family protein n=1 Tax=Leifsonia sp. YAF41 TaxID=3233086 RepID=UPI003F9BFE81
MAFDTHNGTRGARQPRRNRVARWGNQWMVGHVRRTGSLGRTQVLVLVTIGRKTGAERMTPVGWFPGGGDAKLIVASASGAAHNPSWYLNLAAHPDAARIEFAGQRIEVSAAQLHGAERDDAWRMITTQSPNYAKYETITDREIPIIRLTPR